jgi:predicted nucleotidyltransferase
MTMATAIPLKEATLKELVRRIVEGVRPRRILLFGSAVRGNTGPNSDLDILVVMSDGVHRRRIAQDIHLGLLGMGMAKDVVVVTESDVREYGDNPSLVLFSALREGREIYHAP